MKFSRGVSAGTKSSLVPWTGKGKHRCPVPPELMLSNAFDADDPCKLRVHSAVGKQAPMPGRLADCNRRLNLHRSDWTVAVRSSSLAVAELVPADRRAEFMSAERL